MFKRLVITGLFMGGLVAGAIVMTAFSHETPPHTGNLFAGAQIVDRRIAMLR